MKILLIHQVFRMADEGGGTRHFELLKRAVSSGHRAQVITSDVGYLDGKASDRPSTEIADGIDIRRVRMLKNIHRSFTHRLVAFVSFMISSLIAGVRHARDADIVMGTTPPLFQACSAWFVALVRRRPFVLEIRDLWPDFAIEMGVLKNRFLIGLARWMECFLYRRATHIVVNSPAFVTYLIEQRRIASSKISLIPNGVDPGMFELSSDLAESRRAEVRANWSVGDCFTVVYAGALGPANDIPTLVRTAQLLSDDPAIRFVLVGDGKDRARIVEQIESLRLNNIQWKGVVSKNEMPGVLAASDACVAILQDIPMFRTVYPNKVFDYMAAGRPTILAIGGVIKDVVVAANGGICVTPGQEHELAQAVRTLSQDRCLARAMGERGRHHVREHFNRDVQSQSFIELLQRLGRSTSDQLPCLPRDVSARRAGFYARFLKRPFDIAGALCGILIFGPIAAVVAACVACRLGRPVLFRQKRPGKEGKLFEMYKFRSMRHGLDAQGNLLPDEQRMTRLGKLLRSLSLDELPELINVLRGDMSLVGPRPLLPEYLTRYTPEQARRHEIRPGITGWAQVNGRNAISWEKRFELDVWYVDHVSLWLDLKIIVMTIWKALVREGVSSEGHVTMPAFTGSKTQEASPE